MYLLYSFLLTLGVVALLPRFIVDALRHGKYVAGLRERLGGLPAIETGGRPVVWLHCVSVGETQAARPLARAILERFPSHALVVSTTTATGQRVAREVFRDDAAAVIYFPFDWAWAVRRSLRKVNPSAVLIMETELWPNFLRECRRRGVPAAVVNGRLSEKSFRRYQRIRRFTKRIVNDLTLALMQTDADAERMRALGLAPARVFVSGNVKFDGGDDDGNGRQLTEELRARFRFDGARPLVVAASTHAPEERILLEAFKHLRATPGNAQIRLLVAPRHPERFGEVAALLDASGFRWARRSAAPSPVDAGCDVLLLDSIGELRAVYSLAEIVFVGGSIAPNGGHNILEPAAAGVCAVTGAHTFNFKAVVEAFLEAGALVQLPALSESEAPDALANALRELLADDGRRRELGRQARAVLERNRGATARTVELLAKLFAPPTDTASRPEAEGARGAATRVSA
ncbi:MAG TPA: 3-deoxy-D-manno-octulosonic acid transferase [Pyrinomonadaceae bacterium]|nr:3-deoxy-D-manno-octulosonic acid transferase [Pyrinomonadaceae bacterium]